MKILIVEDEHKIANSIKKGLEQEAVVADVAYDGEAGLDLATTADYDVIILDLMLPKISGLEVCKKLRAADIHIPILILTAKGEIDDKVEGLNSGADDYLVKPFAFTELLARVKALNRRPPKSTGAILKLEDLSLNTLTYEVKRGNAMINLSKKEYVLLEYMMRHPNITLTKDQLINNVWDYEADILPNTVEVYIGYLRNKIDNPFKDRPGLIQTIRGFGYKIGQKR